MNMLRIKYSFFILMVFSSFFFAQAVSFDTHIAEMNGELSRGDSYQDNFGRFDAYQLNMQEGDFIKIKLKAEFFPLLTVVAPSGKHEIAFPSDDNSIVNFEKEIDETGHWYIYVSGDSLDTGAHEMQLCYVAENTRKLPTDADICTITNFLLAHSKTNYFYFRENDCETKDDTWNVDLKNQGYFNTSNIKIEGRTISFILQTEDNISKNKFSEWSYIISNCLTDDWIEKGDGNETVFAKSNGARKIVISFKDNKIRLSFISSVK